MFVFFLVLCFDIRLAPHALIFTEIEIQDLVHLVDSGFPKSTYCLPSMGPPRGFGDLGRKAIYFQGAGEHC